MNIEYTKTTFATRQKLLKEEEDKCSELTAQIERRKLVLQKRRR